MDSKNIAISGHINEDFIFPKDGFAGLKVLKVDFSAIKAINSEGVRRMNGWISELGRDFSGLKIEIEKTPPMVTRQLNMIRVYTAKHVTVKSVFVPYYCERCDRDDITPLVTREMFGQGLEALPQVTCKLCGQLMERDVKEIDYFALFKASK